MAEHPKQITRFITAQQQLSTASLALFEELRSFNRDGEPDTDGDIIESYNLDYTTIEGKQAYDTYKAAKAEYDVAKEGVEAYLAEAERVRQQLAAGSIIVPGSKAFNVTKRRMQR